MSYQQDDIAIDQLIIQSNGRQYGKLIRSLMGRSPESVSLPEPNDSVSPLEWMIEEHTAKALELTYRALGRPS